MFEKKFLRGGLIASQRDNYSILHTGSYENEIKRVGCLRKKRGFMGHYDSF